MNIAFYCSSLSWGGLEMNVLRYAGWMTERGHAVKCFFVVNTPLWNEAMKSGLRPIAVSRNKKHADLISANRIARLFRKEQIDVVWYRDNRDLSVLAWAKRISGNKIRIVYQQAMQLGIDKKDFLHTWRFNAIDAWISPLNFLAEQVRNRTRFDKGRLHVIPLGVDVRKFHLPVSKESAQQKLQLPPGKKWVGVIGRYDRLKGQHLAIEALAALKDEFPELNLLLAGESTRNEGNDYEAELKLLVKKYHLDDRVFFRPFSPEVHFFYKALDIFLLTSAGETFGMVTIEAMASGCAVIGTNSSGTPEILAHGNRGLLFTPGDSAGLAKQVRWLLTNPEKKELLVQNAAQSIRSGFDHQEVCRKIELVISTLIHK